MNLTFIPCLRLVPGGQINMLAYHYPKMFCAKAAGEAKNACLLAIGAMEYMLACTEQNIVSYLNM